MDVDVMWIMSLMIHCIMRIFESSCRDFAKVQRNAALNCLAWGVGGRLGRFDRLQLW
jgi:hypothetical protein